MQDYYPQDDYMQEDGQDYYGQQGDMGGMGFPQQNMFMGGYPQQSMGGGPNQLQMAGLLLASGMPFDKALVASAQMQREQAAAQRQQAAISMQQMKSQMMMQQYGRDLVAQKQMSDLINGNAPEQDSNMMPGSMPPQNMDPRGATTLKDEIAMDGGMAPSYNNRAMGQPVNNQGASDISRIDIDPRRKQMAQILASKGDYKGAIDLLQSPLANELAKKDAETLSEAQSVVEQAVPVRQTLDNLEEKLKQLPSPILGPVVGRYAPYLNSDAQVFDADAKVITLLSRTLLKMPASGFSDADRKFLEDASAGTMKTKQANLEVIQGIRDRLDRAVRYTSALEKKAARTGNLRGAATEFYNQEFNAGTDNMAPTQSTGGSSGGQRQAQQSYNAAPQGSNNAPPDMIPVSTGNRSQTSSQSTNRAPISPEPYAAESMSKLQILESIKARREAMRAQRGN